MLHRIHGLSGFRLLAVLSAAWGVLAQAEQFGVIGAGGEVRAEKRADAAVVETVTPERPFSFRVDEGNEWAEVTLAAGKTGWVPLSAIRLHFTTEDLPKKDLVGTSEIHDAARRRGLDYVEVTQRAAQGEAKALKQFFTLAREADGAAAESITGIPTVVVHLLGDEKFAAFLRTQSVTDQGMMRNIVVGDGQLPPTTLYLQRHFPKTTEVLFPSAMVAWPSPDGRYAIRKVFSDPFDLRAGKITRAELIEKNTGRVVLDMTADDIGNGHLRDGKVLWAPDSRRFASLSMDLAARQGNLFSEPRPTPKRKQTVVYQATGDTWTKVECSFEVVPGRERDAELKEAVLGQDYIEPVRWLKPNVLRLTRHEYYEKKVPTPGSKFESIIGLGRWHWITATIRPDGTATLTWAVRKE